MKVMDLNKKFFKEKFFTIKDKNFIMKEIEDPDLYIFENFEKEIENFIKPLFISYNDYLSNFGVDLKFQDFETELKNLPGIYSKEKKGTMLIVLHIDKIEKDFPLNIKPIGMVSLKDLDDKICEMKRLFLIEEFRGYGLGKILMDKILDIAKNLGYLKFRWDTLKKLKEAGFLYEKYKYSLIEPYNYNPFNDVQYFEIIL